MTENTLHWLAVAAIVTAASALVYMWLQQARPFEMPTNNQAFQTIES